MKRSVFITVLLAFSVLGGDLDKSLENTNFTLLMPTRGEGDHELYNYNRFRIGIYVHHGEWFADAIGDLQNHLGRAVIDSPVFQASDAVRSDTPFATRTGSCDYGEGKLYGRLYRLYGGYADEMHRLSLGLQKVSFGVGRIWNPTDLFNPKNPFALEPDEVDGAFAAAYTYSPSSLSQVTVVAAQREDESFKYAGRVKGYLGAADAAVEIVKGNDIQMVGYELEGELLKTGIELRSEGGIFEDKRVGKRFFQGIFGADYAFENSLMVAIEWLHTSRTFGAETVSSFPSGAAQNLVKSSDYFGISGGYDIDPLLYASAVGIVSADDGSFYVSPSLRYSLADDVSVGIGAMLYGGEEGSDFGDYGQSVYLRFRVTF